MQPQANPPLAPQRNEAADQRPAARRRNASKSPRNVRAAFQSFKHFQQLAVRCSGGDMLRLAALVAASLPTDSAAFVGLYSAMDITATGRVQLTAAPAASDDVSQHPTAAAIHRMLQRDAAERAAPAAAASAAGAETPVPRPGSESTGTPCDSSRPSDTQQDTGIRGRGAVNGGDPGSPATSWSAWYNSARSLSSRAWVSDDYLPLSSSGVRGAGGGRGGHAAPSALQAPAPSPAASAAGCEKCHQAVADSDMAPLGCGHVMCKACVQEAVTAAVKRGSTQDLLCLRGGCGQRWLPQHITPCLSPGVMAEYERCMIQEALGGGAADSQGGGELFVTCPHDGCGRQMIMEQQSKESAHSAANSARVAGSRDANGALISFAALLHKELHRLRCAGCSNSFCTKCNAAPYHLGRTCEQHAEFQCAAKCRFCGEALDGAAAQDDVCASDECRERLAGACRHVLPCSHPCGGVCEEKVHLPCLVPECLEAAAAGKLLRDAMPQPVAQRVARTRRRAGPAASEKNVQLELQKLRELYTLPTPTSNGDDYCTICYVEGLSAAPCVQLLCGHVLHWQCVQKKLAGSWSGARITFGFLNCPQCQQLMRHPLLDALPAYQEAMKVKTSLEAKALQRLKFENLQAAPEITTQKGQFYGKPLEYAMHRFAYYPCFKCKKPYFGGMRACGAPAAVGADGSFDPEELVCGSCRPAAQGTNECTAHGKEFIQRKCRFCCSPAVWFCWGTTSFCEPCHTKHNKTGLAGKPQSFFKKCRGAAVCALRMNHPPNGGTQEFSMGCGICGTEDRVAAGGTF